MTSTELHSREHCNCLFVARTCQEKDCRFKAANVGATVSEYAWLSATETALKQGVFAVGPISVAIDAKSLSFQLYRSGVYNNPNCTESRNHAVLAVGYGTEGGQDYWIVKNRLEAAVPRRIITHM